MSIKYEIQPIKNSQGTGEERHFARIYERTPMSANELKNSIQDSCTLTKGDVEATLSALRDIMIRELSQGNRFYIPSIGYFSLSVDLDMPEGKTIDKVRGDYITVRNIKFRPDASVLEKVRNSVRFERANFSTQSKSVTEESMQKKIKDYISANGYINRSGMEDLLGLRRTAALRWLKHFTEKGILRKEGPQNSPVYFWNSNN